MLLFVCIYDILKVTNCRNGRQISVCQGLPGSKRGKKEVTLAIKGQLEGPLW